MSIGDYITGIQAAASAAYERVPPEQRGITWGDHFVREYMGLLIFGEIFTQEYLRGREPEAFDTLVESHARGYRYGKCFSVVEPEGEYGSTHVADMVPISPEQFAAARAAGWKP